MVDYDEAPPEPVFNENDNSKCRKKVKDYYEQAVGTLEY